jgi:membrane dipeptidase
MNYRVHAVPTMAALLLFAALPARAATSDAAAIHERILTLDTHIDTPMNFSRPGWDMMDAHTYYDDLSQIDYPRMVKGGLDGAFFAIFTPQGPRTEQGLGRAHDFALKRGQEIRDMVARHSDRFAIALRADDAAKIAANGKRFVFISMENGYPIGKDISNLKIFYDLGLRMAGPVHFTDNDLADSATDKPEWHGLSPLGKDFVAEANRLGIVLDASHASDETFDQMLELSKTPIILSHSGARAVFNHPRNIDDARIKRLADKGGVIQINSYSDYLIDIPPNLARVAAMRALNQKYGQYRTLAPEKFKAYMAERHAVEAQYPLPEATLDDVMNHLLHVLKLVGPDRVGIGLDMDGGGGVVGMEDIAGIPEITKRLVAAGYGEEDLAKIWGGNALRLLRQAEAYAAMTSQTVTTTH